MTCILKSLYYDDDQISNVSILTKVSVMQVECWIDSAKVPNVSIVLTFGLTSNEDTSLCSPNLGGGTALAAGCCWLLLARAALRRKFLFYLSLLTCGWLVAMVAQQSSALSRQSYQISAPDNTVYTILREYIICTHYKAVMYKCMCIQ